MRHVAKNNLGIPIDNIKTFTGDKKGKDLKREVEDYLEDVILAKCQKEKARGIVIVYGTGHGVEDKSMIQFVTNHYESKDNPNNLCPLESVVRNTAAASNGLLYSVGIYDMCRT